MTISAEDSPHVDVELAKRQFAALERRITNRSHHQYEDQTTADQYRSSTEPGKDRVSSSSSDVEKGALQEAPFNLRDYLTSSNEANQAAGIQHKHVGVTWEDLQVDVMGGMDSKVLLVQGIFFVIFKRTNIMPSAVH